jgi:hypothetical protein
MKRGEVPAVVVIFRITVLLFGTVMVAVEVIDGFVR